MPTNLLEPISRFIVVKALSSSTGKIDLVEKLEIDREAGARQYWIFDRSEQMLPLYRFAENGEEPAALLSFDQRGLRRSSRNAPWSCQRFGRP